MAEGKVVKYQARDGNEIELTFDTIRRYLVSGRSDFVTQQEMVLYMGLCKSRGLNPFIKDCYLVKYTQNDAAAIITSIDYYRKRARAQKDCQGWKCGIVLLNSDKKIEYREGCILIDGEKLVGAWFEATPTGWLVPLRKEINLKRYIKKTREGKTTRFWSDDNQPEQIVKVVESQGLRAAWPDEFQGLYIDAEMQSMDAMDQLDKAVVKSDETAQKAAETLESKLGKPVDAKSMPDNKKKPAPKTDEKQEKKAEKEPEKETAAKSSESSVESPEVDPLAELTEYEIVDVTPDEPEAYLKQGYSDIVLLWESDVLEGKQKIPVVGGFTDIKILRYTTKQGDTPRYILQVIARGDGPGGDDESPESDESGSNESTETDIGDAGPGDGDELGMKIFQFENALAQIAADKNYDLTSLREVVSGYLNYLDSTIGIGPDEVMSTHVDENTVDEFVSKCAVWMKGQGGQIRSKDEQKIDNTEQVDASDPSNWQTKRSARIAHEYYQDNMAAFKENPENDQEFRDWWEKKSKTNTEFAKIKLPSLGLIESENEDSAGGDTDAGKPADDDIDGWKSYLRKMWIKDTDGIGAACKNLGLATFPPSIEGIKRLLAEYEKIKGSE